MVDPQALYAVLGLSPGADHAAVRNAYRTLARRLHPDVNRSADAVERMRDLNAAYDALRHLPLSATASPAGPSPMPRTAPSPAAAQSMPFGGFPYRVAAAGTGAVSLGSFASPLVVPVNGITIGIFAGLVGLVTLFVVWSFTVARPLAASTVSAPQPRVTAPVASQSTASTLAAQARANAAANAAAARSNLTASTRGEVAGINSTTPVPAVPAVPPAAGSTSAGQTASPAAPAQSALTPATSSADAPSAPAAARAPETSSAAAPQIVAPVQPQIRAVQPAVPAVPATQPSAGAHITTAGQAPAPTDAALVQTATRALSNYDKAWTAYATALRVSAAGTMVAAAASAPGVGAGPGGARMTAMSPTSLLSGEGQLTMARMAHFQQQLAWNTQAGAALTAAIAAGSPAPRPDPAKTVRADQRLRQAADLLSQSTNAAPLNPTQLKPLLDEAEQLHRESVAEWAKLLATLG